MITQFSFLPSDVKCLVFYYSREFLNAETRFSPVHQISSIKILILIQSVCKEWCKLAREPCIWQGIAEEMNIPLNVSISLQTTCNDSTYAKVIFAIREHFCQKYRDRYSSFGNKVSQVFHNLLSSTETEKDNKTIEVHSNPFDSFKKKFTNLSKPETMEKEFEKLRGEIQKNPEPLLIQSVEDNNFIDFRDFFEKNRDYVVPEKIVKKIFMEKEVSFILCLLDQSSVDLLTYDSNVIFNFLRDPPLLVIDSFDTILNHPKMIIYLTEKFPNKGKLFNEFLFFTRRNIALSKCLWRHFVDPSPNKKIVDLISNLIEKNGGPEQCATRLLCISFMGYAVRPAKQDLIKEFLLDKIDPVWGFTVSRDPDLNNFPIDIHLLLPSWDLIGKNVNVFGESGLTPLMILCSWNDVEGVKILIKFGGDLELASENKCTPLYYACEAGAEDVVKFLLEIGVNVNLFDENGRNIFLKAAKKNEKILSLLAPFVQGHDVS